jgi:Cell Wall Hydrolase
MPVGPPPASLRRDVCDHGGVHCPQHVDMVRLERRPLEPAPCIDLGEADRGRPRLADAAGAVELDEGRPEEPPRFRHGHRAARAQVRLERLDELPAQAVEALHEGRVHAPLVARHEVQEDFLPGLGRERDLHDFRRVEHLGDLHIDPGHGSRRLRRLEPVKPSRSTATDERCDGRPESLAVRADRDAAFVTAKAVLTGSVADPTNGALFFHASRIRPGWFESRIRVGEIGNHVFYC